ncbi:MAG: hypothetical protein HFI13_05155 [Lachnospiraceae bacterium]|nr:hypothetical protein [Lachnospiraceae bacterium]
MNNPREWNPYYMNSPYTMYPEQRAFPWLYPYGSQMNYWNLWNAPERMEDETDTMRLRELYPLMARRLQPYVEEVCTGLEYPGSMMYDEYPDQLSLLQKAKEVWNSASRAEDFGEKAPAWEQLQDLIGVLLLQEMMRRRKKNRGCLSCLIR